MAFKLFNAAFLALLVITALVATGFANIDDEGGRYNELGCKNKNPTKAMKLAIKETLDASKNARITFNANKNTSQSARTCEKAYKDAEFEIKQVREILKSKDLRAIRPYISAASIQYTKCGDNIAQNKEVGIMASKNSKLMKQMTVLSGLSTNPCST